MSYGRLDTGWQPIYRGDGEIEFDELEIQVKNAAFCAWVNGRAHFERFQLVEIELEAFEKGKESTIRLSGAEPVHTIEYHLFHAISKAVEEGYKHRIQELGQ